MRGFIIAYGIVGSFINIIWLLLLVFVFYGRLNFDQLEMIKYGFILLSLSITFFGVRAYRDKILEGSISIASGFFAAILMVTIISLIYTAGWLVATNISLPGYSDKYTDFMIDKARLMGKNQEDITKTMVEMEEYKLLVQNPTSYIMICMTEIFPIGLVFSILVAYIAKRSSRPIHIEDL